MPHSEYHQALLGVADLFRSAGLKIPHLSVALDVFHSLKPDYIYTLADLRWMTDWTDGDFQQLLEAIPAAKVPAEISGAWFEAQSSLPSLKAIGDFLSEDDNEFDVGIAA